MNPMLAWLRDRMRGWFAAPHPPAEPPAAAPGPTPPPALPTELVDASGLIVEEELTWDDLDLLDDTFEPREPLFQGVPVQVSVESLLPLIRQHVLEHLPEPNSFPTMASRVIAQRYFELEELIELASSDLGLATAVLRAANAPRYYGNRSATDVRGAILLLGVNEVTQIALGVSARALFEIEGRSEYELFSQHINRLFHSQMTGAFAAAWLAKRLGQDGDRAFTTALFCDLGKTTVLRSLAALVVAGRVPAALDDATVELLLEGLHVEAGVAAQRSWGLPEELQQAAARHHEAKLPEELRLLHVVRAAVGVNQLRVSGGGHRQLVDEVADSLHALGISRVELTALADQLRLLGRFVTDSFGVYAS